MKIDMNQTIPDLDGKPVEGGITLGAVCAQLCWNPLRGDDAASRETKLQTANIALKIRGSDSVDLTAEEIALLKDRVDRAYPHPGLVMRIFALLDPPALIEAS